MKIHHHSPRVNSFNPFAAKAGRMQKLHDKRQEKYEILSNHHQVVCFLSEKLGREFRL